MAELEQEERKNSNIDFSIVKDIHAQMVKYIKELNGRAEMIGIVALFITNKSRNIEAKANAAFEYVKHNIVFEENSYEIQYEMLDYSIETCCREREHTLVYNVTFKLQNFNIV